MVFEVCWILKRCHPCSSYQAMNVAAVLESVAAAHIRTSSANFSQPKLMARMQGKVVITRMLDCLDKH